MMKKSIVGLSLLAGVILFGLVSNSQAQERRKEGAFQTITGQVTAQGPAEAKPRAAAKGDPIYAQDRVVTAPGAKAQIRLEDGSVITLQPSSKIQIMDSRANSRHSSSLMLVVGWVQALVDPQAGSNLEVQTATAVAGVRGTEFTVAAAVDGSSRVGVAQGEVALTGQSRELSLKPNQQATVEFQQKALAAQPYDPQAANWSGYLSARAKQMAKNADRMAAEMDRELERRHQGAAQAQQTLSNQFQQVEKISASADAVQDQPDQYDEKKEALKEALVQDYSQARNLQRQDSFLMANYELLQQLFQDVKEHPEKYSASVRAKVAALEAPVKARKVAELHQANQATLDSYSGKLDALVAKYDLGRELQQREYFEKRQQQQNDWEQKRREFIEQHRPQ